MQTSKENKKTSIIHKISTRKSKLIEITREFSVPVEKLFHAFTNAEDLKVWWWPKDLYADRIDLDLREGGRYFFNMKGYDQGGGGMTGEFEEIIENKRLVMTDQFADAKGRPISAAEANMPGEWPEKAYITFEFETIDENHSRFKLFQQGIPNELQKDCIHGWNQSFDKLQKYLKSKKH